ncbi:hypothetical protein HCN44_001637 [Aphidius gifuensis]|uniref:PWWP domain-containing protein n=1 Tax=Aphidius gifuensis TaxID=684658 RepID=A0A835CQI9_APHGI|nr:hepatoma-derived growth factor-related protein 2 isoform X2 [Aphidius gifuensis]KAF7992312.1 hypothetical protein HCN44_001637 [Aphidius gifuensis]
MKLIKKFSPGDKVFAKVRGYPPWPARVEEVTDGHTKNAKYKVFFYGTGETASCKCDELFTYHENKEKYGKHLKRKAFHEGMQQLEQELNNDQRKEPELPKETNESFAEQAEIESSEPIEKEPTPPPPATPAAQSTASLDSDLETGPLVIDEGDKKKQFKRKSLATPAGLDSLEPKKKRARGKAWTSAQNTPRQDPTNESLEEMAGKEVVSRSGRKIKPKRFADFSSSDEFDTENSGRGRGKNKLDDLMDNQSTPSSEVAKKRTNLEKDDKKVADKESLLQKQQHKLRWLRMEHQLLTCDAQIKSNLGLESADADKCISAMEEMLNLPIDPLMLKKHSHIVETIKRLRRYIGNLTEWKLEEEDMLTFKQKAESIRQKAEQIYGKFKALFTIPENQTFWELFSDQLNVFKDLTKDMPEEKVYALMCDPSTSSSSDANVTDVMMDDSFAMNESNTTDLLNQSTLSTSVTATAK